MFIEQFVHYMKSRTDAPPDFHVHAAIAALSYALGSNVWCDGWTRPIYPNLWVIIIAPSGYGKSAPLDMAESVVRRAGLSSGVMPGSFSQEALLQKLKANPTAAFFMQEFSAFVRALDRDYNSGATQWLTELYDVPKEYPRVVMGKNGDIKETILHKPCITILGASSPAWFNETFKEGALRGGFLARFIFCPSTDVGEYVGHPGPPDEAIEVGLAGHLQMLSHLHGPANFNAVQKKYNEWDEQYRKTLRKDCPAEFAGMRSRAGAMVRKATMLYHASEDPETLDMQENDLDRGIKYVEISIKKAERYLSNEVAHDHSEAERLKLLEIVAKAPTGMLRKTALMNSHLGAQQMDRAIETLVQSERLVVEHGRSKSYDLLRLPHHEPAKPSTNGNGAH